jgi:hypothetical protein
MIKSHLDKDTKLTMFICSGTVAVDEIEDNIRTFYSGKPTLNSLWDFTDADVSRLSQEDILHTAELVKTASHSRAGGKTALVFPNEMLMGMMDILEGIARIEVAEAKIKIFNGLDLGLAWIREE